MKKTAIFFFVIAFVVISANAQERRPVAISPASDSGIARVAESCPTFSWTGMEWATGYEVVVFETNGPNVLSYDEMTAISSPVLKREIRGRALAWTPSSDDRLSNGSMYMWYVQAVDGYGIGIWSEGRMFKVELEVQFIGMEDTLRDSLRENGMSEEAIEDVLEDMRPGMKEVMVVGVDPQDSEAGSLDVIGIQGIEDTDNTFYGSGAGYIITNEGGTGEYNSFFGSSAGYYNSEGSENTFIGYLAGNSNSTATGNTFVGLSAGCNNTTGHYNTFIGRLSGLYNTTGSFNVFLGNRAGYNETGSFKLYIDNSSTSNPLIWGDFSSDILTVHGKLGVGTKSPAYQMEVETTGENAILLLDRTDGAKTGFSASGDKCAFGTLTNHPLWMVINGAFKAIFHTDGSLQMMNGAWCTAAGKWQDASSRELKENIHSLTVGDAKKALEGLDPVRFNYKADKEDESLGFIAEDVPELVASKDRKSMSPMDVLAVLTKVVQEQQKTIYELQKKIDELKGREK